MREKWLRLTTAAQAAQVSVTDAMIIERAYQSKKFFEYNDFRPNKRWLDRFKRAFYFEKLDLVIPNPRLRIIKPQSLKLSDIFHDMKDNLDSSVIDAMRDRKDALDFKMFLMNENNNEDDHLGDTLLDHATSSNNEKSEVEDSDYLTFELESVGEAKIVEEAGGAISSDEQALECIKRLEEYSMLKDNYRAMGLIMQLEQVFKGQLKA